MTAQKQISIINLAARQRMLSQRMVLQTVLAAEGDTNQLAAARETFQVFCDSQNRLRATVDQLDAASARRLRDTYDGVDGVAITIDTFIRTMDATLQCIAHKSPQLATFLETVVATIDPVLEALNTVTTTFESISQGKTDLLFQELSVIVSDIQTVAREAKVVSFNAQVIAARAGQQGREFAVVANVLSGITNEIDGLSKKAVDLAARNHQAA